ncbi:MAG: hypothetical protein ABI200_07545 [Gaiellales bacterium]
MLRLFSTFSFLALLTSLLLGAASAHAAKTPSPKVRVVTKSIKVSIAKMEGAQGFFQEAQSATVSCKYPEMAVGSGIAASSRYIAGQSFGPSVVGGYATGAPGKVTVKMQALCVRNGKVTHKRPPATTVPGMGGSVGGRPAGRATAKGSCGKGYVAVGAPLSQGFAPGYGSFSSTPFGARGWRVIVNGVPEQLSAMNITAAYADFSCVKAKRSQKKKLELELSAAGAANGLVKCTGGRRALGWGVELGTFTTWTPRDGAWNTPMVTRAQFVGTNMAFKFATPPGADTSTALGTKVTAHVVCGVITA